MTRLALIEPPRPHWPASPLLARLALTELPHWPALPLLVSTPAPPTPLQVVPIEDDYVIGKELGRGRFSVVCECVHKQTGVHYACKVSTQHQRETDRYRGEGEEGEGENLDHLSPMEIICRIFQTII